MGNRSKSTCRSKSLASVELYIVCARMYMSVCIVGLLDYDKNHNHDYFGQYCNHDYLTRLLAGRLTKNIF